MITITTHTSHFRRSKNGAWLDDGATTESREIPDDADVGAWLHGGVCQTATATWPDGMSASVSFGNVPVRGYGWGPYGHITRTTGEKEGVRLHPRIPGWALGYYGLVSINPETTATFEEHVWT